MLGTAQCGDGDGAVVGVVPRGPWGRFGAAPNPLLRNHQTANGHCPYIRQPVPRDREGPLITADDFSALVRRGEIVRESAEV